MERYVYLSRKETATRKANGQFKNSVLAAMADELRNAIVNLKHRWYTSPMQYGIALMNRPRNKHGKRVLRVTNF